jgi:hypothetical protein
METSFGAVNVGEAILGSACCPGIGVVELPMPFVSAARIVGNMCQMPIVCIGFHSAHLHIPGQPAARASQTKESIALSRTTNVHGDLTQRTTTDD